MAQQDTSFAPPHLVVGLGASAGGVEALEAFFSALPKADGVAFVVVLHLAPDEESRMADVLASGLPLPVTQVTERVRLEAGHVYVIPPDRNLLVQDGHLVLEPIERERVRRRPVDHFFRTLADAWGDRAVGVILSGLGANGTVGARRLRETGGAVLVQAPEDAEYDEMPRTAIAADIADFVGSTDALAREVIAYAERMQAEGLPETPEALPADGVQAVQSVLAQLRARTGHDFAHYKRATILRRLDRRLHVTGAASLGEYVGHLRGDAAEAEALLNDLLISVTNFFRDPPAFDALEAAVPGLFEGKASGDEVRAWVPGCATGEEAYSVAMLLLEHAATLADPPAVQVFATDLSGEAVRKARAGLYPASIEADVSAERLRRFFSDESGQYRVSEALRETVLFATHSVLKDPPFSRLDLVSCRNLLIYLQRSLQDQVLAVFHYALRHGGLLFLGTSETTDGASDLYDTVSKETRLYRRRDVETPPPLLPRVPPALLVPPASGARGDGARGDGARGDGAGERPAPGTTESEAARLHRRLRDEIAPPSVLVSEDNTVVHVSASASAYLRVGEGAPSRNLIKMLRPELRASVQTALFKARRQGSEASVEPIGIEIESEAEHVGVRARPAGLELHHVVFEPRPAPARMSPAETETEDERVAALDAELHQTREQLQVTVEEFETSREELKAQNEELQSINEELRSTAEELETAKEEAQSMSEELRTVNDEIKGKVDELSSAKGDLENLIASTEIATLFLDRRLRIKRFTPHVREHFHVLAADLGRPLADLAQKFGGVRLAEDAEAVLERLEVQEREIEGADGRWYLVQVRPYRSVDDRIDGVVITFVDITRRKADEESLRQSVERFRALVEASSQIVWTTDARGLVVEDSPSWRAFTGQTVEEWTGEGWADAVHPDDHEAARERWRQITGAGEVADLEFRLRHAPTRSWRTVNVRAVPLRGPGGDLRGYVGMNTDVTEQRQTERDLRRNRERLTQALAAARLGTWAYDAETGATYFDGRAQELFGFDRENIPPREVIERVHPDDREAFSAAREAALASGTSGSFAQTHRVVRPDGSVRWVRGEAQVAFEAHDGERRPVRAVGVVLDVTEQHEALEALRASEARFRAVAETVPDILFSATPEGEVNYVNARFEALTGRPPADILHTNMWPSLLHPDDYEEALVEWQASLREQAPFEARHRLLTAPGGARWVLVRARPVRGEDGGLVAWFGTMTDIDRLARAEAEVRQLNATLEARVRDRTAQVRRLASRLASAEQAERRRIAQILHDDLQQRLAGLGMTLDLLGDAAPEGEALHAKAREVLGGAIELTRTLAVGLSPPVLHQGGLDEVFQWLASQMEKRFAMAVELDVEEGCEATDEETLSLLYQSVRELLFNVIKHAGTRAASVRVRCDPDHVEVVVEDEGSGYETGAEEAGFGLFSVQERLELVGGTLATESEVGVGTRVTLTVPQA